MTARSGLKLFFGVGALAFALALALEAGSQSTCSSNCVDLSSGLCSAACLHSSDDSALNYYHCRNYVAPACESYFEGFISLNDTHYSYCCGGNPSFRKVPANVTTCQGADSIGSARKSVVFRGQIVDMVVAVVDKDACKTLRAEATPENVCGASKDRCRFGSLVQSSASQWTCRLDSGVEVICPP